MDMKSVMAWLEGLAQDDWRQFHSDSEVQEIAKAAFAVLKEQEAVRPRRIDGKRNHFIRCGNCNYDLMTGFQFCPHCGKSVKWDGTFQIQY